jgi:hypothetical protein
MFLFIYFDKKIKLKSQRVGRRINLVPCFNIDGCWICNFRIKESFRLFLGHIEIAELLQRNKKKQINPNRVMIWEGDNFNYFFFFFYEKC